MEEEILYLCDRHACSDIYGDDPCPNPDCWYTKDICHAVNFKPMINKGELLGYIESSKYEFADLT